MGPKPSKSFDNEYVRDEGFRELVADDWEGNDWHEIFLRCCSKRSEGVLQPSQIAKFLAKLFKYLQMAGNSRQFVATMMTQLDVGNKQQFRWEDIVSLRETLRALASAVKGSFLSRPSPFSLSLSLSVSLSLFLSLFSLPLFLSLSSLSLYLLLSLVSFVLSVSLSLSPSL